MYSVVVATFNRARYLGATLESLLAQGTDLSYEIIVVDNNSSDETRAVARDFEKRTDGKLRYVFEKDQGLSKARNAGIAAARGVIIAFVDDDVIVKPTWLEAIAAAYRTHRDAWCVGGKIMLPRQEAVPRWFDPTSKYLAGYLSGLDLGDETIRLEFPSEVWGANFSVRREIFARIGLFDPTLGASGMDHNVGRECHFGGEESELCLRIYRAGGAIYYCGRAVVTHCVSASRLTRRYFRQRAYWQGRTVAILFPRDRRGPLWRKTMSEGLDTARTCARMLLYYCVGDISQAFACELSAWSRLGRLQQTFLIERTVRRGGPAGAQSSGRDAEPV